MLTVAQLVTMTVVFVVVFIYNALRPAESQKAFGVVEGILWSQAESSALIDGQIIEEGEKIYGVRVTKIYGNKVEFEDGSRRWEQRVREQPNLAWGEPNLLQTRADTAD